MSCSKCSNGYIKKIIDGEEVVTYCECRMEEETKRVLHYKYEQAGIPKDYWDLEFSDYQNISGNQKSLETIDEYKKTIDDEVKSGRVLYLWGENNSGKTMITCCILKEAIKKGYSAKFITMSQLVTLSMKVMGRDEDAKSELEKLRMEQDIIAIDDAFDTEKVFLSDNGIQNAQMDDIFRTWVHNKKALIVTSNVPVDKVSEKFSKNIIELLKRKIKELKFTGRFYESDSRS